MRTDRFAATSPPREAADRTNGVSLRNFVARIFRLEPVAEWFGRCQAAGVTHKDDHEKLFHKYLEHHQAGAAGGIEHIERMAEVETNGELQRTLKVLAQQICQERDRLRELAEVVGADSDPAVKKGMAWLVEKLARGVIDPGVASRSPLGRVLDLELMMSAVAGKRALWQALTVLAETDLRLPKEECERGIESSVAQIDTLLDLHRSAVRDAFTGQYAQTRQAG